MAGKKKGQSNREKRRISIQQIIFTIIAIIIILSFVFGMIYSF